MSQVSVAGRVKPQRLVTTSTVASRSQHDFSAQLLQPRAARLTGTITITSNAPISFDSGTDGTVSQGSILSANPTVGVWQCPKRVWPVPRAFTLTNSGHGECGPFRRHGERERHKPPAGRHCGDLDAGRQIQTMSVACKPTAQETVSGNIT